MPQVFFSEPVVTRSARSGSQRPQKTFFLRDDLPISQFSSYSTGVKAHILPEIKLAVQVRLNEGRRQPRQAFGNRRRIRLAHVVHTTTRKGMCRRKHDSSRNVFYKTVSPAPIGIIAVSIDRRKIFIASWPMHFRETQNRAGQIGVTENG